MSRNDSEKNPCEWQNSRFFETDVLEKLHAACCDNIERVEYKATSKEEFRQRFDDASRPCIVTGVVDEVWSHEKNWSWQVAAL